VIAWDLFVGRWIYLDSRQRGLHPLLMAPLLVLTILLSPVGLPVYFLLRLSKKPEQEPEQKPEQEAGRISRA
jgi:hypothetical protein